jgi:alginate O-acetyltransferase complex protein AlgI
MFNGFFMVIERLGLDAWLSRQQRWLRHMYLLIVVMVGWVFFRAESISSAWSFLGAMFGFLNGHQLFYGIDTYLNPTLAVVILVGILASGPIQNLQVFSKRQAGNLAGENAFSLVDRLRSLGYVGALTILLLLSMIQVASDTYNPFIYFRF